LHPAQAAARAAADDDHCVRIAAGAAPADEPSNRSLQICVASYVAALLHPLQLLADLVHDLCHCCCIRRSDLQHLGLHPVLLLLLLCLSTPLLLETCALLLELLMWLTVVVVVLHPALCSLEVSLGLRLRLWLHFLLLLVLLPHPLLLLLLLLLLFLQVLLFLQ
jgi:hypothetical protein